MTMTFTLKFLIPDLICFDFLFQFYQLWMSHFRSSSSINIEIQMKNFSNESIEWIIGNWTKQKKVQSNHDQNILKNRDESFQLMEINRKLGHFFANCQDSLELIFFFFFRTQNNNIFDLTIPKKIKIKFTILETKNKKKNIVWSSL